MKLYLLTDDGWDKTHTVVRAESETAARTLAGYRPDDTSIDVTELATDGPAEVIWTHNTPGPDSVRDPD